MAINTRGFFYIQQVEQLVHQRLEEVLGGSEAEQSRLADERSAAAQVNIVGPAATMLEMRFADLGGQLVASRRFKPGEYLKGDLEGLAEMPPQTPIHIALDILDPGPKAVNYSLSFHSPE